MKKSIIITLLGLLICSLLSGCAPQATDQETTVPEDHPTEQNQPSESESTQTVEPQEPLVQFSCIPEDLLDDTYNLFNDVELPDTYTITGAEYVKEEFNLYYLFLTSTDSAEDIVTYFSNLLGDNAEESIQQNLDYLLENDIVFIHGTQVETGLNADAEISLPGEDSDTETNDGYRISLIMNVDNPEMYESFLGSNLNALSALSGYVDIFAVENADFKVDIQTGYTQLECGFQPENIEQTRADLISAFADDYHEEQDQIRLVYGDLLTSVSFDLQNNGINISHFIQETNQCLKDYIPAISLNNLGFQDLRDESAKCNFRDDENNFWISISKEEWGENPHSGEINAVTFYKNMDGNTLYVFYHPATEIYSIIMEYEGEQIEYQFNVFEELYLDEFGGEDLDEAKQIAENMFNKPGTDNILQDAWVTMDITIEELFGIGPKELFELVYE